MKHQLLYDDYGNDDDYYDDDVTVNVEFRYSLPSKFHIIMWAEKNQYFFNNNMFDQSRQNVAMY